MSWILWVVFTFSDGTNLKYPLEVYDAQHLCESAAKAAVVMYARTTPQLFGSESSSTKVATHCLGASAI